METRRTPRISMQLKVTSKIDEAMGQKYSLPKGNAFEADVLDLSVSGAGLKVKYFLPKGLIIALEFDGAIFGLQETMKLKGEVRYCLNIEPPFYKCGIKLVEVPEKYKEAVNIMFSQLERRKDQRLDLS